MPLTSGKIQSKDLGKSTSHCENRCGLNAVQYRHLHKKKTPKNLHFIHKEFHLSSRNKVFLCLKTDPLHEPEILCVQWDFSKQGQTQERRAWMNECFFCLVLFWTLNLSQLPRLPPHASTNPACPWLIIDSSDGKIILPNQRLLRQWNQRQLFPLILQNLVSKPGRLAARPNVWRFGWFAFTVVSKSCEVEHLWVSLQGKILISDNINLGLETAAPTRQNKSLTFLGITFYTWSRWNTDLIIKE